MKYLFTIPLLLAVITAAAQQNPSAPDTVSFKSGKLTLKGLFWKPSGTGPFPAVLFNHGSEPRPQRFATRQAEGFLKQGYAVFVPCRRGQGLSQGQGNYILDALDSALKAGGQESRIRLLIKLHSTTQLQDQLAAYEFLKNMKGIDTSRLVVAGVSFGGIQTMLMAAQKTSFKAAVNFAGAAMNWDKSAMLQDWMKAVAATATIPVFFIQAENDFSIKPSLDLSAHMKEKGREAEVKIYPPHGSTPMDGHTLIGDYAIWTPDVFPALKKWLAR
jgi:carboxymethylenebutenolidase